MDEVNRRLAGILAADVVGYSAKMGADDAKTLARVRALRTEVIEPLAATHGGRLFKTMGDGFLVEFPSAVQALRCAIAIQTALNAQAEGLRLRIGLHQGEVVADGDDLFGDGVIVAARLEPLAESGGIVISSRVKEDASGKIALEVDDLGEPPLKNIAANVRAFRVRLGAPIIAPVQPTLTLPDKPSVAVLPFQNMSGDHEQEYFSDGMAEDIITALSKLRSFFVIARNSTFSYKGKSPDVRQVARELGVRYVLEGSVRKGGNRMRITAQLIDGVTGNHICAERYDRELVDIFGVQDDITRKVVGAIEPQLFAAENLRIQSKPPESLDAWGCVIRGLWHLGRFTKDDNDQALQLLRRAVALSPAYAKAHSVLAFAEARTVFFDGNVDTALSTARQEAQAARALDDDDPWSYFSSGYVECFLSKYDDAIAWYRRAIKLNENFALAHGNMAAALAFGGQPDAAIEAVERSIRMSPRDPFNFSYLHFAGIAHFAAERYAEGVVYEEQALRERPNVSPALRCLAACHVGLGQIDKARSAIAEVLRLVPESSVKRDAYGQVAYARESDRERFAAALRKAGLPEE
jgi:adenylate cyclase